MNKSKRDNLLTGKNFAIGLTISFVILMFLFWVQSDFSSRIFTDPVLLIASIGTSLGFSLVLVPMILGIMFDTSQVRMTKKKWVKIAIILAIFVIIDFVQTRMFGNKVSAGMIISNIVWVGIMLLPLSGSQGSK